MPINVDWGPAIINVPISYMAPLPDGPVGGTRYELDVDQFRLDLKGLEASAIGMTFSDTHTHDTQAVIGGIIYARRVLILEPYVVQFEAGIYEVNCVGANHNVADRKVVDSVSIVPNNSAGLVVVESPAASLDAIADAVWSEDLPGLFATGEAGLIVGTNLDAAVSSRGGPNNRVQMVWTDNATNNRMEFEAFLQIDEAFINPGAGATLRMELISEGALVYDISGITKDANGIFRSFVPRGTFVPLQEQNLFARGTITDGATTYVSAVGLSVPKTST